MSTLCGHLSSLWYSCTVTIDNVGSMHHYFIIIIIIIIIKIVCRVHINKIKKIHALVK